MTAKYPRHIALTGSMASYIDGKIAKGEYASASEVIRTALRLLIERDAAQARMIITGTDGQPLSRT
ncbi:MAG: type II toxin-antitoxin system ParD family antitoxin [Janthinobacterium lividum]